MTCQRRTAHSLDQLRTRLLVLAQALQALLVHLSSREVVNVSVRPLARVGDGADEANVGRHE